MNWHYEKNGEENVRALAKNLCETPELAGFEVKQDDHGHNGRGLIRLIKGDLDIRIHEGRYNEKPGKLFFSGSKPADPYRDIHTFNGGEIGVSISRGSAVIAREIARRLLPDYTEQVKQALSQIARETQRRASRDVLLQELAELLPSGDADLGSDMYRAEVRFLDGRKHDDPMRITGEFKVHKDLSVYVGISTNNLAFIRDLAALITDHSA